MSTYYEYKETAVELANHTKGILYEPVADAGKSHIGIVCLHSHGDYSRFSAGRELARRGYRIFCSGTKGEMETMEDKVKTVGRCVEFMKNQPGIEKILLVTHSGGATLMSCYQSIAENGVEVFRKPENIYPFGDVGTLPAADGVVFLDANWGNAFLTLFSINPMIIEEGNGMKLDEEYNLFDPKYGYDPKDPEFRFDEGFVRKYLRAQAERNNRIVDLAVERLKAIEAGEGRFIDDEPFLIAGGSAQAPKFYSYNPKKLSHTKVERNMIHADGSITSQIVPMLAQMGGRQPQPRELMRSNSINDTVRIYLSNYAVRANPDEYYYDDTTLYGVDFDSTCCATTSNVRNVHVPMLVMGMTGGQGVCCNEHIFENVGAADKTLMYVEGAEHMFTPNTKIEKYPGQFGDTMKLTYDYADGWVAERFV